MYPSPPAPFTSAHGRARIVKFLLVAGVIITTLSLLVELVSLSAPPLAEDQELGDNPMGAAVALMAFLIALPEIIIYLATVVFFCMWLYRAHRNLRAFRPAGGFEYSSGLAVGSFFIPFANLIIPYRAVREVWQKSGPPDEALFSEPSPPALFPTWWTFWLLASFAGNLSMRLTFNEKVDASSATIVSVIASALSIVAGICAYLVVDAIDKRQEETSGKLDLGRFSGPPPPPSNLPDLAFP